MQKPKQLRNYFRHSLEKHSNMEILIITISYVIQVGQRHFKSPKCLFYIDVIVFYPSAVGADYGKPCSQIYTGLRPFSEPEIRNLAKYMYFIRRRIKGYVDFHSYGQLWMSPWGYTSKYPPSVNKHVSVAVIYQ